MMKQNKITSAFPLVSVILPVFNAEKYLNEAVDSILAQTFTDFELIAINDGSTDNSGKILQNYAQHDSRIRIFSRENKGLPETLNELIDLARGAWIARMDADDIALPNRLERQLAWLSQTDADICGSWAQRFDAFDRRLVCPSQSDKTLKIELLFHCPLVHPSIMMRRSIATSLYYDTFWDKAEDYDLWVRAAESNCRMTNVPEVLLFYRLHSGQTSSKYVDRQRQLTNLIREKYWNFMSELLDIDKAVIVEISSIFSIKPANINIKKINDTFEKILMHCNTESRKIIFGHITRLYLKNAVFYPKIAAHWGVLNNKFGVGSGIGIKICFQLFRLLKIHENSITFKIIHMIYIQYLKYKNI